MKWAAAAACYAVLLIASRSVQNSEDRGEELNRSAVEIPAISEAGPEPTGTLRLSYLEWPPSATVLSSTGPLPVVLLHGSPGDASAFTRLGPELAARGYRTLAFDLPGFGHSRGDIASYSILADARTIVSALDKLSIPRAHVVGWSNGGGVAIHMADLVPDRVSSLTLLASIGAQESEGSGSHAYEHLKYRALYPLAIWLPDLLPHFGLLGKAQHRIAFVRSFSESDQRPLADLMRRLRTPTLILHGRRDFLVAHWAAQLHHRLIGPSTLVMLDASHFFLFSAPRTAADHLVPFFRRHDTEAPALRQEVDLAPFTPVLGRPGALAAQAIIDAPAWVVFSVLSLLAAWRWHALGAVAALLSATNVVDAYMAIPALSIGALGRGLLLHLRARRSARSGVPTPGVSLIDWQRRLESRPVTTSLAAAFRPDLRDSLPVAVASIRTHRVLACLLFAVSNLVRPFPALLAASMAAYSIARPPVYPLGVMSLILGLLSARIAIGTTDLLVTRIGRRMLLAVTARLVRYEFWPAWLFYAPLVPYLAYLSARYGRGRPLVFTACNPGIACGGGVVGESKQEILSNLRAPPEHCLECRLVPEGPDPEARTRTALSHAAALRGFPVVLKPDASQRGFAMRVARSEPDVRAYFRTMTRAAIVQQYHPGPLECGVLWARDPACLSGDGESPGRIFSITRKDFSFVTGDGERTLEDLIYCHTRFRCQASVFLRRFADQASAVPARGERLRLAEAGNHCQGTLFRDGSDLITGALGARIDAMARGYRDARGRTVDFCRFDLRYESDELLREGRAFGIVELNGTTAESTNIYDPKPPGPWLLWPYSVLFAQWSLLYRLGAARAALGCSPLRVTDLLRSMVTFYHNRPGESVSD